MKSFFTIFISIFILFGCSSGEEQSVNIEGTEWVSIENGTTGDADDIESGKQFGTYYRIGLSKIDILKTEEKYKKPSKYSGIYKYDYPDFVIEMDNGALAKYNIVNGVMSLDGGDKYYGGLYLPEKMYLCINGESTYKENIIDILTKNDWKLVRLTDEGSNMQFYSGLWESKSDEEISMENLKKEFTFNLNFNSMEMGGGRILNTVYGVGFSSDASGTWSVDEKSQSLKLKLTISFMNMEYDDLARAFIYGLKNVYKYESDDNTLTLYFKDGSKTRVMGFIPVR